MLSIGKLAAGQAKYYLEQAQGRVDAIQSLASGAEDYYTHTSEARGVWLGCGAAQLELRGVVGADELRRCFKASIRALTSGCGTGTARSASPRST